MKTKHILRSAVLGCGLTFLIASCSDDDNMPFFPTNNNNQNDTIIITETDTVLVNPVAKLFTSSNTSGLMTRFLFSENMMFNTDTFVLSNADADGIFYDNDNDAVYQNDRSNNRVQAYLNFENNAPGMTLSPNVSSTSDFVNAREIAVMGNMIVVAQDATDTTGNKFLVYKNTGSTIVLDKVYDSPINLWGIFGVGSTLFAVQDNSDTLAIFNNFFSNADSSLVATSQKVQIEGIVRTHGLTYCLDQDIMVLTDVADGTLDNDGAIHVISDFSAKLPMDGSDGMIALSDQIRIAGPSSLLGNPVDVAVDEQNNIIYTAERKRDGGRVLGFMMPSASGDATPIFNKLVPGASAVHFSER